MIYPKSKILCFAFAFGLLPCVDFCRILVYFVLYQAYVPVFVGDRLGNDLLIEIERFASSFILRGTIVIRTHDVPKNPYIPVFLHTILGPD